jgi:outer membrane biosynthesis protein TonB
VVGSCPVCETPLPASADHCPRCGFPSALSGRLDGPVAVPAEPNDELAERPVPGGRGSSAQDDGESEVNASLARSLEERTELLRTIDRDAPDVTGELCEAALNEASGRTGDAQQILRSAQGRLDRETEELLARHLESLENRGRLLESTGLKLALEDELGHLAESIVASSPASSVAALAEAELRMDELEAHWRGLQGLLGQVATLRAQATELGIRLPDGPDRLSALRSGLASRPATDHDLDAAAQAAAETLMHLHEAIPPALEQELARHAKTLEAHRGRSAKGQPARRHHAEALQHLKNGRLEDAARSVQELRAALEELAQEAEEAPPAPVPVPPTPVTPPAPSTPAPLPAAPPPSSAAPARAPAPRTAVVPATREAPGPAAPPTPSVREAAALDPTVVATLMNKARSLAVRVRSLPPDSAEAADAARQIHEATDLLRAKRYAEADAALTRLMRALASAGSGR